MPPPAPWLSHFAACLPDLPQTLPYLVQAPPPLYTRPPSQSTGPSPSPSCLAQTSTIYTYYTNIINDSLRNLIKRKTYRESRTQPSFFTLLLNTIWSIRLGPHTLLMLQSSTRPTSTRHALTLGRGSSLARNTSYTRCNICCMTVLIA